MSKVVTLKNVTIQELYPDDPSVGAGVWRMITWTEEFEFGTAPMCELQRAEYILEEGGDCENGPRCNLTLDLFETVSSGTGICRSIEEEVSEFLFMEEYAQGYEESLTHEEEPF